MLVNPLLAKSSSRVGAATNLVNLQLVPPSVLIHPPFGMTVTHKYC
jgi:hypothetical protein